MADLLYGLSKLDGNELQTKIDELKEKETKSLAETLFIDMLQLDKETTYSDFVASLLKDINGDKFDVIINDLLSKKLLSGQSSAQYVNDINSLTGQIDRMKETIRNGELANRNVNIQKESLERMETMRNTKISNMEKVAETKGNIKKATQIGKALGILTYIAQGVEISKEQWEDYSKNGVELDDALIAGSIDGVGIWAGVVAGSFLGDEIGTAAGTLIAPGPGSAIGFVAGAAIGAAVGFVYGAVVDPILTDIYNNAIEPVVGWAQDTINDIGDWGDTLWW